MSPTPPPSTPARAFTKVEGLGNDFILLDHRRVRAQPSPAEVRWLCDRHRGVGADGVLELLISPEGLPWMRLHNADGGLATMCGNGLRCIAWYLAAQGEVAHGQRLRLHTDAGPRAATICGHERVQVELGAAQLFGAVPMESAAGRALSGEKVDVGNPHWIYLETGDTPPALHTVGPVMQHHPAFPDGVNVSVARPLGPNHYALQVWERGVGPTQACGSAASATAATIWHRGLAEGALQIDLPGGPLRLEGDPQQILMSGPARVVYEGRVRAAL